MSARYYVRPEHCRPTLGLCYFQVWDSLNGQYVKGCLWQDEADKLCARLNAQEETS